MADEKKKVSWSSVIKAREKIVGSDVGSNLEKYSEKVKPMIILIGIIVALLFFVVPFIIGLFYEVLQGLSNIPVFITSIFIAFTLIYVGGMKN